MVNQKILKGLAWECFTMGQFDFATYYCKVCNMVGFNNDMPCAYVMSIWETEKDRFNGVSPYEHLKSVVEYKFERFNAGDKGAKGDAAEMTVKYYMNAVKRLDTARVSRQGAVDTHYHGIPIEVGTAGKQFTQAGRLGLYFTKDQITPAMFTAGDYDYIVYCERYIASPADLLNNVLVWFHVFTKEQFCQAISGKHGFMSGIKINNDKSVGVQYCDGLVQNVDNYIKANNIPTLKEFIESH